MSELTANSSPALVKDENENKDSPTKRTPSKRKSHIERIQEESKELLKNMGVEELSDTRSTRRSTRSSTKGPAPTPVTPPTPKRQPATPSSSSRGKKKQTQEDEPEEEDVVKTVSPKQTPPRKRQKLSDTIKAEELKNNSERVEREAEVVKADVVDAQSQEENGSDETMEVEEEKAKEKPQAEEISEVEGKLAVETIPEETTQEMEAALETVKPVPEEKPLQAETKSEEAPLVADKVEEPVERMEVDSAKSTVEAVTETPIIVSAVKESPPEIIVSAPEPEAKPVASADVKESDEQSVTSSSENSKTTSKVDSVQVPEVSSDKTKDDSEATAEQTQVSEISSDNPSQVSEDKSAVVVPPAEPFDTLPTESITEQSKIESTQDEPISAPIETETAQ